MLLTLLSQNNLNAAENDVRSLQQSVIVDNVGHFCNTAARLAAGLLVLTTYVSVNDLRAAPRAFFAEPEAFASSQVNPAYLNTLGSGGYNPGADPTLLKPQPKPFSDQEVFAQQYGPSLNVVVGYGPAASPYDDPNLLYKMSRVFSDPEAFPKPWVGAPLITAYGPANSPYIDPTRLLAQAKYFAPEETFPKPWVGDPLVTASFGYNPGTDPILLNPPDRTFGPIEVFVQQQLGMVVVQNTFSPPYDPTKDPTQLRQPVKFFSDPESYFTPMPVSTNVVVGSGGYNPGTDVTMLQPTAKVFSRPEAFTTADTAWMYPGPYDYAHDVRRWPHARVFARDERWSQYVTLLDVAPPFSGAPFNPSLERRRPQAQVFSRPEHFALQDTVQVLPQGTNTYNAGTDVIGRQRQAVFFADPETFTWLPLRLPTIASNARYQPFTRNLVFGDEEVFAQPMRPSLAVLGTAGYIVNQDFRRSPTQVFAPPELFVWPWVGRPLVVGSAGYNPATDPTLLNPMDRYFGPVETFASQMATSLTVVVGLGGYNPAADPTFFEPQKKYFADPEVFAQAQRPSQLVVVGTAGYDYRADRRSLHARHFADPEAFPQAQRGYPLVVGTAGYNPATDFRPPATKFFATAEEFVFQARASLLVVLGGGGYNVATDRRSSHARHFAEPEVFAQAWRSYPVALAYNWQTDVRRAGQALVFSEPERFEQPARSYPLTLAYNWQTDVRRAPQARHFGEPEVFQQSYRSAFVVVVGAGGYAAGNDFRPPATKFFAEPEAFVKPMLAAPLIVVGSGGYDPGRDVRRRPQAVHFAPEETFVRPQVGAPLVITTAGYNPAIQFWPPARKFFVAPEEFVQPRSATTIINATFGIVRPAPPIFTITVVPPALAEGVAQSVFSVSIAISTARIS